MLNFALAGLARAESCEGAQDMDAGTRSALESTGQQFFNYVIQDNTAALQQNAIPSLASNFGGIQQAVDGRKNELAGASATSGGVYVLDASDKQGTIPRAEFYCGVWGANGLTPNSYAFVLPNLPAGKYALAIEDVKGREKPYHMSFILQQVAGGPWKLAGLQIRDAAIGDHDGTWFLQQARAYKAKGETHNAYFYYAMARDLIAPVPFMTTLQLQQIDQEQQAVTPSDLPTNGPVDLLASGKTYQVTQIFPVPVANGLNLVVRYKVPDISDTQQAFADNMAVIKAIVAKYPEYRDAFAGVVARATAPSGQDYGSLLAMKDVK